VINPNYWIDTWGLKDHGHHSDPKFMGGDPKQKLTTLSDQDHINLHKDLNAHLDTKVDPKTGTTMRPKRGNSGADIQRNFSTQKRLDALAEFYTKNKNKYPDASADFFAQHPQLQKPSCP
jgi:hypothetical protein